MFLNQRLQRRNEMKEIPEEMKETKLMVWE
jgi:hypothetical protein